MPEALLLLLAAGATLCGWWWWRRRRALRAGPLRTGLRRRLLHPPTGSRAPTVQSVADAGAAQMGAVVMLVVRDETGLRSVACAPWGSELGPLDTLAAGDVFDDGKPAGKGARRHGMSDWLFVPVITGREVVAVAAVAGRNNRRSFDPLVDRDVAALVDAFRTVVQPRRNPAPAPRAVAPATMPQIDERGTTGAAAG